MVRLFAAVLAAATLFAAPLTASATPHVLTYAGGIDLTTLNPLQPEAAPNYELNYLTMAYLTRFGSHGFVPELLASMPTQRNGGISRDGKSITLRLRPELHWSDGEPLTSADIAFSVATINDPKTNTQYHTDFERIVRVDTPDALTAVLRLKAPYGQALESYFSSRGPALLPKHLLSGVDVNTAPYQDLPIGAGPFRYTKWVRGDRVELERNPRYALGTPKLERIVFKMIPTQDGVVTALRTSEIDFASGLTFTNLIPLRGDPAFEVLTLKGVRPARLEINTTRPLLRDVAVRRALRMATDRASILQRSYLGSGVLVESGVTLTDPNVARIPPVPFDLRAAGKLLDDAGWKRGPGGIRAKGGTPLAIELIGGAGSSGVDQIIELVRANWTQLGVQVSTKRYPLSLMFAPASAGGILFGGKFDVALFSSGQATAADAADSFRCGDAPPNGGDFSRYCDTAYDRLVARADATYDPAVSGPLYRTAQRMVAAGVPEIVLVLRNEVYPYRGGVVTNVAYPPFAFFPDPLQIDVVK